MKAPHYFLRLARNHAILPENGATGRSRGRPPGVQIVASIHRFSAFLAILLAVFVVAVSSARADFDFVHRSNIGSGSPYGFATDISFADLGIDGSLDAVVTFTRAEATFGESDGFSVSRMNANGANTYLTTTLSGNRLTGVRLADLDGDGLAEIVVADAALGSLRVYPGRRLFPYHNQRFPTTYPGAGVPGGFLSGLELGDLDQDGKLDAFCGDQAGGVRVLRGNGLGGFFAQPLLIYDLGGGMNPRSLNVLDIDDDGKLDIVYAPLNPAYDLVCISKIQEAQPIISTINLGVGLGEFKTLTVKKAPTGEVLFCITEPGISTFAGTYRIVYGRNPLAPTDVVLLPNNPYPCARPVIADLNRDGVMDLAVVRSSLFPAGATLEVRPGQAGASAFGDVVTSITTGTAPLDATAVDINNDGWLDLALGFAGSGGGYKDYGLLMNRPPLRITSGTSANFEEGVVGSFTVTASGDAPIAFATSGALPTGLTLSPRGVLSGAPAANTAGEYLVTIVASNGVQPPVGNNLLITVNPPLVPRVIIPDAQNVTTTSAALGGQIQTDNGFAITRRGVVYAPTAVNPNPQLGGPGVVVRDDSTLGAGAFGVQATGLTPGTAYSFVAFAQNARGVGYTSVATFFTPPDPNSGSLVVTTLTDENDGNSAPGLGTGTSLREAIAYAKTLGGNQTITFLPSLTAGGAVTTTLALGELPILNFTGTLTIAGPGADKLTISGGNSSRILRVDNAGLQLNGLTLANASGSDGGAIRNTGTLVVNDCVFSRNRSAANGGAIYQLGGTATVMRSTFTGNAAANPAGNPFTGLGGAIANAGGTVWVINSTLHGNTATANGNGGGGAIASANGTATVRIINSTITGNSADGASGGVYLFSGNVVVQNSIVAGNTAPFEANLSSSIFTAGLGNVIGGNLTDLFTTTQPTNNGGTTATFALKSTSAAINAGLNALAVDATGAMLATDQLGGLRVRSTAVDAGSTEAIFAPTIGAATLANLTGTSATLGGNVISDGGALRRRGVIFSRTADNANPALGGNGAIVVEVSGTSGVFSTTVSLVPRTGYSFVAFVESDFGVLYSSVLTFTTLEFPSLEVTTTSATVDPADGETSLREAVAFAQSGGAPANTPVTFAPALSGRTISLGTVGDNTFGPSALLVSGNVTIDGGFGGVTIARDTVAQPVRLRLFYVTSTGNLTLKNVTVSGGRAKGGDSPNGGGGAGLGGAIVNAGTLNLIGATLTANEAIGGNGAGFNGGGGGLGGDAVGANGGGPNGAIGLVPAGFGGGGSTFDNDGGDAGFGGGGSGPAASGLNGGFGGGGGGGVTKSGFGGGAPDRADREGKGGGGLGGAVFNYGGTVNVLNTTLAANTARGGTGGYAGSGYGGAIFNLNGQVTCTNATLGSNIAPQGGGAIYSLGDNGVATQNGPVLVATTSITPARVTLNNSILADSNNGATTPELVSDYVQATYDSSGSLNGSGAGFVASSGANNLVQTRPAQSANDFAGTAITANPLLSPLASNGGPTMTMALLAGSPAIDAGNDALAVDASNQPLNTDQRGAPRITRGNAASPGARVDIGAYELIGIPTFTTSAFTVFAGNASTMDLNTATGPLPASGVFSGAGVTNGLFDPMGLGRGVYTITYTVTDTGGATNSATVTITILEAPSLMATTANDVTDPLDGLTSLREAVAYAQALGGGPTITFAPALQGQTVTLTQGATGTTDDTALRNASDLTIEGAGVTLNLASTVPRRHFLHAGGTLNLRHLTLSGGDLRNVDDGGALYNTATVNLTNVRCTGNHANSGGAVMNLGTLTVENATFDRNDATTAAAQGGAIWSNGTLGITGTLFYLNSAGVLGGAIASFNGLTVSNCTFSGNHSDFNGGAVRLDGAAAISASTFSNNSAVNGGGAIMSHGATTLANVTIAYNVALDGGGIQFFDGAPSVRHATIAYNSATRYGGGIAVNFADVTLKNTLVAGNTESAGIGTFNAASTNNLLNLTDVQAGLGAFAINGGPTFTIALLPGSPAINSGAVIAELTTDQRGLARAVGSAPDIGAVEDSVGEEDPDRDSLTNFAEFLAGTNPLALDTDGDGFNDATEMLNGTDSNNAASVPSATHVERVLGFGPARGLDLTGSFLYAFNVGTSGAAGQAGDATFTADNAPGVTVSAPYQIPNWNTPDFGNSPADDVLEFIYQSMRWNGGAPVRVDLANLIPGRHYKLQLLFGESCCVARTFDVFVQGALVANDFKPGDAQGGVPVTKAASALVHEFTAGEATLTIVLDGANVPPGSTTEPILNGVTLEDVTAPASTPFALGDATPRPDGSFAFRFSNTPGAAFRILASTDVALPLSQWSILGPATETPPGSGQFQFTDAQATNSPQRFYRVTSP